MNIPELQGPGRIGMSLAKEELEDYGFTWTDEHADFLLKTDAYK